jgi:hypothetical protein
VETFTKKRVRWLRLWQAEAFATARRHAFSPKSADRYLTILTPNQVRR